ncbi:MAG: ribbon-helix-helix protein, CopG family [Gemmatimonadales bacterium]
MSHRLQVLIPDQLDRQVTKAAQREGVSKGEWVRRALDAALRPTLRVAERADPLDRLGELGAPTADIDDMLADIDRGRA